MRRLGSSENDWVEIGIPAVDTDAALDHHILHLLSSNGRTMTARELADHINAEPRSVVGRLQALKRRGVVAFTHNGSAPSAPGWWTIVEREGAYP